MLPVQSQSERSEDSARTASSTTSSTVGTPEAPLIQSQLATLAEGEAGAWRPLLEYLRVLLNARALALFPSADSAHAGEGACVVTTRGVLATSMAELAASLGPVPTAFSQPAPQLGPNGHTFVVPVSRTGRPVYLLLVLLVLPSPNDLRVHQLILQTVSGFILYGEQRKSTERLQHVLERSSAFLEIFKRAGMEPNFAKACRIAVDELRDYIGCARVVLGTKGRAGIRVRSVSGIGKLDAKSTSNLPYEAAMKEAVSAGKRVDFSVGLRTGVESVAIEILQQRTNASHLAVVPLASSAGGWRGAVVFEWEEKSPPSDEARLLLDAALPFLPALFDLLDRARAHPALSSVRNFWRKSSRNRRIAMFIGVAALTGLLACPFAYRIKADCRLVPTVKRVVAAPFTGELREPLVRPGDKVIQGQKLAEMDNRDLSLREAELVASRDRALKQRDRAMSNNGEGPDYAAAQVAQLEARSIDKDLQLVRRKIALLTIQSPLAGVVVLGDLRRAKGIPVQQGQVLFEVAPLDEMIVEIDVPDREISHLRPGLPASFRLEAFAGESWKTRLDRVHPQAEQRDNRNVFVCEAAISNANRSLDLRPGMRGRATIVGDRHSLAWILTHRLWDLIVTTLFW